MCLETDEVSHCVRTTFFFVFIVAIHHRFDAMFSCASIKEEALEDFFPKKKRSSHFTQNTDATRVLFSPPLFSPFAFSHAANNIVIE